MLRAALPATLLLVLAAHAVRAQSEGSAGAPASKEDLGDTGAAAPTPEDLGRAEPPEPEKPPEKAPEPRRRKRDPSADAGVSTPSPSAPPAASSAPAAAPTAPPPAAPVSGKAAAPATAASADAKVRAQKAADDLQAALLAEPGDARALDGLAQSAAQDTLLAAEPTLRALVRLARGRALMLQGRLDEAGTALGEARAAADANAGPRGRAVAAQVRYRIAELEEKRAGLDERTCGLELGLWRLASFEGKRRQESLKKIAARYKSAAQGGDRFWARRAAFRTAQLYEAAYREALAPAKSLRGIRLPSPFTIGRVSTDALLDDVVKGPWPAEIARLYSSVIGSVDARDPDPALVEAARKAAAELGRLTPAPGESAENPWLKDEHEGLIRYTRRFEQRGADGRWHTLEPATARKALAATVDRGTGSVDFAYALVALAEASPAPPREMVKAAIASEDPRTRLAGLVAAERAPDAELFTLLVDRLVAASPEARKASFTTLQGALYGELERTLLALRALAAKNREVAEKILQDNRIPAPDRVWLVAEVGDARLQYGLQSLTWNDDPTVAARAIFGLYLAQGRSGLGSARPQADGLVGCVSRAVHAMDGSAR